MEPMHYRNNWSSRSFRTAFFFGIPIAWSLGFVGFVGLAVLIGPHAAMAYIFQLPWSKMSSYTLILMPIFIFMGSLTFESGLGQNAYKVANKWVGHLPGGLASATALASGIFAAVTGSSMAGVRYHR